MKWKEIDKDDFSAEYKDYLLRVERMDKSLWWWGILHNNGRIVKRTEGFEPNKESAKQKAESYFK